MVTEGAHVVKRLILVLACASPAMAGVLDREISEIDAESLIAEAPAQRSILTTTNGQFGANLAAASVYAQESSGSSEDVGFFFTEHTGMYVRVSGLVVDQLNDIRNLDTGEQISFDTGGGFSLAGGYRDLQFPVAFELEYAFRRVNADDNQDTRYNLSTLTANVLFDASDILGPVGVYAGGGLGITIDQVRIESGTGGGSVQISSNRFFWQVMAGVTLSVHKTTQLYAGIRFTDAGTYEEEQFRWHSEALNYEFGLRFFF